MWCAGRALKWVRPAPNGRPFLRASRPCAPSPALTHLPHSLYTPEDYGGHSSNFSSNVVYVNNGWNCVNIASFRAGHADSVFDNDCIITQQERVDSLFENCNAPSPGQAMMRGYNNRCGVKCRNAPPPLLPSPTSPIYARAALQVLHAPGQCLCRLRLLREDTTIPAAQGRGGQFYQQQGSPCRVYCALSNDKARPLILGGCPIVP